LNTLVENQKEAPKAALVWRTKWVNKMLLAALTLERVDQPNQAEILRNKVKVQQDKWALQEQKQVQSQIQNQHPELYQPSHQLSNKELLEHLLNLLSRVVSKGEWLSWSRKVNGVLANINEDAKNEALFLRKELLARNFKALISQKLISSPVIPNAPVFESGTFGPYHNMSVIQEAFEWIRASDPLWVNDFESLLNDMSEIQNLLK
jgi:hypothetical protein